jgi:hypothetical protein
MEHNQEVIMAKTKEGTPRIVIQSQDGTFENTVVEIDGKAIGGGSKKLDSVSFFAERPFDGGTDSYFRFRASTVEKDGDTEKITTTRISNSEEPQLNYFVTVSPDEDVKDDEEKEEKKDEEGGSEETKDEEKTDEEENKDDKEPEDEKKDEDKKDEKKNDDEKPEEQLTVRERRARKAQEVLQG